jgi:DNA-binding transcriptional MerR regulator
MAWKEKPTEKLFYSIGEVAGMFQVNTSLIRFWEKEFEILKPSKNKKGNRVFTRDDIENFRLIFHLVKEKGYTLDGAKEKLKNSKKEVTESAEVIQTLKNLKSFLLALKKEIPD